LTDLFKTDQADDSFLATQVSILQSDDLVWETIQQLGMAGPGASTGQVVGIPAAMKIGYIRAFQAHLHVRRERDARMLMVSFESSDPSLAATAVNTLIKNFTEYNIRTKYDASRQATGWMEQRLDELKVKVEKSQQAMMDYERRNSIVAVSDKQTAAEMHLEDLSKDLTVAQTERLSKESLYKMVAANDAQVGFVQANSLLSGLEAKEVELKEQYSEISSRLGPTHPKALSIQDQLKDLQPLLARERRRAVENLRNQYLAAVQREAAIAGAVAEQKREVEKTNQLLIEHNMLKRDFDSNQQLYDSLLQRLKDANVSAGLQATNIHVIDRAVPPSAPIRPDKTRNIEFAMAAGFILGIALALTREALDNSIKSAQEIEKLTSLPTLAIVPIGASGVVHRRLMPDSRGVPILMPESRDVVELSVLNRPGAPISESFRALRTSVLMSSADGPPKVILVTSAQPREGKTSTSINLAFTLAQKGSRVMLVDCDLRRPGISKVLNLPNAKGVSGILTGAYEFDLNLFLRLQRQENLYVLPSGPCAPNPAELLCSAKMETLVKHLREKFDHVIIDSPPVLPVTDSTILSNLVDGVIMVVECEGTSRAALSRACRILQHASGKVLGTVFNKVDSNRDGYYGYRYYHGYYSHHNNTYYTQKHRSSKFS
jgi:capsular exopolysaccharide synthesis family protein